MRVFNVTNRMPQLTRAAALKCIPIKNTQIQEKRLETGEVLVTYPIRIKPWLASMIRRFGGSVNEVQLKKLQLDELGTTVWDLMDGRRSVHQLIKIFAAKYHLETKEAEVSMTRFIRMLGKRGLIGLK